MLSIFVFAEAHSERFQLRLVECIRQTIEHILRATLLTSCHRIFAIFQHIPEDLHLRPQVMIYHPFHQFTHGTSPCLIVEDVHDASILPSVDERTFREIPDDVIISEVGQSRHISSQVVDQFIERSNDEFALANLQSRRIFINLLEESLAVFSLSRDNSATPLSLLVRERDTPESAHEELVLVEFARRIRGRGEIEVYPQHRVPRHALSRSTERPGPLTIEDVAKHLRHLFMTAAHLVGHFDFRHVVILRMVATQFTRHRILQERRCRDVRRRKPKSHIRSNRSILAGALRPVSLLPFRELLHFSFIVHSELVHDGLDDVRELTFAHARLTDEMRQESAWLLPRMVRIHKLRFADVSPQSREKHRDDNFAHIRRDLRN